MGWNFLTNRIDSLAIAETNQDTSGMSWSVLDVLTLYVFQALFNVAKNLMLLSVCLSMLVCY